VIPGNEFDAAVAFSNNGWQKLQHVPFYVWRIFPVEDGDDNSQGELRGAISCPHAPANGVMVLHVFAVVDSS